MERQKLIGASELGDFVYCRRSWWRRRVRGVQVNAATRALQVEGERWHAEQGQRIAASGGSQNMALALVALAIAVFLFWLWGTTR